MPGETYTSKTDIADIQTEQLASHPLDIATFALDALTRRKRPGEIYQKAVDHMGLGLADEAAAAICHISPEGIRNRRKQARRQLGARTMIQTVAIMMHNEWLPLADDDSNEEVKELSPMQERVIRLSAIGMNVHEIAETFGITRWTVDAHFEQILSKQAASSRPNAIYQAYVRDILQPGEPVVTEQILDGHAAQFTAVVSSWEPGNKSPAKQPGTNRPTAAKPVLSDSATGAKKKPKLKQRPSTRKRPIVPRTIAWHERPLMVTRAAIERLPDDELPEFESLIKVINPRDPEEVFLNNGVRKAANQLIRPQKLNEYYARVILSLRYGQIQNFQNHPQMIRRKQKIFSLQEMLDVVPCNQGLDIDSVTLISGFKRKSVIEVERIFLEESMDEFPELAALSASLAAAA